MASSRQFLEILEQLCRCPICLGQYTEPKLLPCAHRCCRNCLQQLIENSQSTRGIKCPECRGTFQTPGEGADGFKTDFYIKNVIECIQLQKTSKGNQLRKCGDCSNEKTVTAYCFRCTDFLCKECHYSHVTKEILKDHKQQTLSLEDIRSKNMTLEELVSLKEAPRCQNHPENLSQLCCATCNNLPICVTCTFGSHANHTVKDVNKVAMQLKETLHKQMTMLSHYKYGMYKMLETVDRVRSDLLSNVEDKKKYYQTKYEANVHNIETEIQNMEDKTMTEENFIRTQKEMKVDKTRKKMEKDIEEVRQKYGSICDEVRRVNDDKLRHLKENHDTQVQAQEEEIKSWREDLQMFMNLIDNGQKELEGKLEKISLHFDSAAKRFENLSATALGICDTGNDWIAVQLIPDIRLATEPLSLEMKREFLDIETLSKIEIKVSITPDKESPIHIEGIKANGFTIDSITHSGDGNIVIAGPVSNFTDTHITVFDTHGKVFHQRILKKVSCPLPFRACTYLSQLKLVTVSFYYEIGVYDLRDGSYMCKDIRDIISCPKGYFLMCVASDSDNRDVLVGGHGHRDVYVFDEKLTYKHTLSLPEIIEYPTDMISSDGTLLVCDNTGGGAFAFTMEGLDCKLLHEFKEPAFLGVKWSPISVCKDKYRYVYMLWEGSVLGNSECVLVQYSQDGRQILTEKPIDKDAKCVALLKTGETEKLVVATEHIGPLYIYDLGSPSVLQ